ncbi:MAG: Rpn family recombination-promoting nuclease/putative transposase [Candidatus Poribacteria bacterium]|nr:Rpn family recombination-promoting nuclease/putative transposase [Candidatus Poribacteria bacterium]
MNSFDEVLSFLQEPLGTFPDRSARWLLSNPDNLHGLLEIIGNDLVGSLDFRRVRRVNTTFIADNLREQESDLVFLLPFRDADEMEVMIYILLEHQSTVDPAMGFRLLFYMVQIWDQQRQKWVSENVPKGQWRFRPIIPVVFYTGEQVWQPLPSLEILMDIPGPLVRFVPRFESLFLGVKSESDANLLKTERPFGWLMTLLKREEAESNEFSAALERLSEHLGALTEREDGSWKQALYYLYLLVFYQRSVEDRVVLERFISEHQQTFNLSDQEASLMQSMAEHYIEQGIEQGARETTLENTVAILKARFPRADVNTLKPVLEGITDLDRLKALNLHASLVSSLHAFQHELER